MVSPIRDLRKQAPRPQNASGQTKGPTSLQVGKAVIQAWKRMDSSFLGYSFVQRCYVTLEELAAIGFDENELAGILGGNFRRVADAVWK